jgi:hypothetical protein
LAYIYGVHNKVQGCIVAADGICPARMRPALDQLPEFLLFYSIYIIPCTFKYIYSFDQQELLIRLSLILVFIFSNARTKKLMGTASPYPALDITLNLMALFLRVPLIKPY